MSQQKPPNPGRRRFFGDLLSTLAQEAGQVAREARLAAREIEKALAESQESLPALVEAPIHTDLDEGELAERLDALDVELAELEGQVERLAAAAAHPHALAEEDRALLRRVAEALAERHTELAEESPAVIAASDAEDEDEDEDDERAVLRRRRAALRERVWALITALLGVRLFDALYETFVSDELVPWAAERWRGIFARAEAAGVIEESPLPSPTAESPHPAATATPEPETPTPPGRSTSLSSDFDWVTIPAGQFLMGSARSHVQEMIAYARTRSYVGEFSDGWITCELPRHRLYLAGYRISRTPVTVTHFAAFVEATGYRTTAERKGRGWAKRSGGSWGWVRGADWRHPRGPGSDVSGKSDHPVTQVSWWDVMAFCHWAKVRLPSEAEWEKAARGNDGRLWPWGNEEPDSTRCNFDGRIGDTTPAGSYANGASPYGALDMAGNVWEWANDWYDSGYYAASSARNPQGPTSGDHRVLRDGSWYNSATNVRAANRSRDVLHYRDFDVGFRLVAPGL